MKKNSIIIISVVVVLFGFFLFFRPGKNGNVANYPSKGTDIIAFGDSLVEGVGSTVGHDFVSVLSKKIGRPIINLGNSGDTTADGIARISQLDNYKPKVVLLLLGGNDHLKKVPVTTTVNNLGFLIKNIQSRGAIVLLLGVRGGLLNDPFKKEFEELSEKYHTAYVPDVLDGLFGKVAYMSDSVHPNDVGYGMIAAKIYPVLFKLLN